ncbi:MAG: tripartite tricarboxylate transporter substrate binding protein [Burkholderiales bacterium]
MFSTVPKNALLLCAALLAAAPAFAQWKPNKPINVIVPWAAGGATDQMIRVTAGDLEAALGQKIVVLNQPGASGSIGTKNALEATKDGYTWTSGAPKDLGSYKIMGMVDTTVQDWHMYLHLALPTIVSVPANSPHKDMKSLLDAMRARPGQVSVGTAGVNSSGHTAIEQIVAATGIKYKHVTYDGGNPAVIATVAGETDVTTQLSSEQSEMIRGKRLRPLAVVGDKAIEIEGYGRIAPLSDFIPGFKVPVSYFGIFVPKGVPAEVIATLDKIWAERVAKSEMIRKYATSRGALMVVTSGAEAQKIAMPAVADAAWQKFDAGQAKISPATIGIPRP